MPEAILLTEESVEEFAAITDFTEERLRYVLSQSQVLRYILVTNLDPKIHWSTWMFMDDHYFRSLWEPESEVTGKEYIKVTLKELPKGK